MLVARSKGWWRSHLEIEEPDTGFPVGVLQPNSLFSRSCTFVCVDKQYEIQVSGWFSTAWDLRHEGTTFAQARTAGFLGRRVEGTCDGKSFVLRQKGLRGNRCDYFEADIRLGVIRRSGFIRQTIEMDVLETVPAWAQIFLAAICRTLWVQQDSQQST
jgi:hypothetical protein